jgi:putative membrane protein
MTAEPGPAQAPPPELMPPSDPLLPAAKLPERPHPLTPFIRGWVVLLALILGIGREFLPNGEEPRPLPPLGIVLAGIAVLALCAVVAGFVSWRFTRFVIDADELRVDTGAIFRRSMRVAFDKVQSIDVVQPFAARLFGLAELQIDVGSHERSKLRYLQLGRAYALRDYLLTRARGYQAEAATSVRPASVLTDLHESDEVLVQVSPQMLVLAAVTSHEFWGIVLGGVLFVAVGMVIGQWWVLLAAAVPTISGLFSFVGRRVTGQFNYTLSRRAHGLRISRGLTSLTSQSLPSRRVQAAQLSQSPVWRLLGLYRIDIEVIGWGAVTDNEDKTGVSSILLPAGTMEQVRVALGAIWPRADFASVELVPAPRRARWLHPFSGPFLRWGHDAHLVVSRHGWLVRRWQLVPHARVQSVRVTQGPVSRRLGLADLEFHTAGMHISAQALGVDAGQALARQAELLQLLHQPAEHDLSEPFPAPVQAGPEALRADQAEATISSTE